MRSYGGKQTIREPEGQKVLKINKTIKFAPLLVLVVFLASFVSSNNVSAISANSGVGHATGPGIADNGNLFISNTGGAKWEYYPWGSSDPAGGLTFLSSTTATIAAWSSGSSNFAIDGANITCPEGTLGLWRYSFVALKDLGSYKRGHLVGVIGIDGNSYAFNSEMLPAGGDMKYISGNWSQVENEYKALLAAGAVSIPWGGGSGLSWFCSADGSAPTPKIEEQKCEATKYYGTNWGKTDMTTKVINATLTRAGRNGVSGWKEDGTVYAMPTDDVQWYHCYAAGVQNMYNAGDDTLRKAIVDGSTKVDYDPGSHTYNNYFGSGDYCSGYSDEEFGYKSIDGKTSTTMDKWWDWSKWTNFWELHNGGVPVTWATGDEPGSYKNGTVVGKRRDEGFTVNRTSHVGSTFVEDTTTGAPKEFSIDNDGDHRDENWPKSKTVKCKVSDGTDWPDWAKDANDAGGCQIAADWQSAVCWGTVVYPEKKWHWETHTYANKHDDDYMVGDLDTGYDTGFGKVVVPFNFNNSMGLSVSGTDKVTENGKEVEIVYAGDVIKVNEAWATVGTKWNGLTGATYATIVPKGEVKFVTYATKDPSHKVSNWAGSGANLCNQLDGDNQLLSRAPSGTNASDAGVDGSGRYCKGETLAKGLNPDGILGGITMEFTKVVGNNMVFDANAGDYMCMAMAIYPTSSGRDDQTDSKGNDTWDSETICIKIAKKPYFGVYGGSIYTAAKTATLDTAKTNMIHLGAYDDYKYKYKSGRVSGNRVHFGSFAEQSVFGIDAITGLASGSAFKGNNGASNNNYCENLVPLTMANAGKDVCSGKNSNVAGLMGKSEETENVDKSAYTDFWLRGAADTGEIVSNDGLGESTRYYSNTGKNIYYTYRHSGDGGMGEIKNGKFWAYTNHASIPNGTTRLVRVDGNLEITDNIIYSESGSSISSAGDLPQVIIYATENISIRYNVERIDAMLIAGGTIYTGGGLSIGKKVVNDERLSYPLIVRGIMIADKLYLDRTYGAAAGYNYSQSRLVGTGDEYTISGGFTRTPAETINYDTSTILWARYMAGTSESNTMTEVYRTELAPRY